MAKTRYLVKWPMRCRLDGEDTIARQTTTDLDKFCRTHNVIEAYEIEYTNYKTKEYKIIRRVK